MRVKRMNLKLNLLQTGTLIKIRDVLQSELVMVGDNAPKSLRMELLFQIHWLTTCINEREV